MNSLSPSTLIKIDKLAGDASTSLEPFYCVLDMVIDDLRRPMYADPIPLHLLPKGAVLMETLYQANATPGLSYRVPADTEYEDWIKEYGDATGAQFVLSKDSGPQDCVFKKTYWCHKSGTYTSKAGLNPLVKARPVQKPTKKCGCEGRIFISQKKDENEICIKIAGHTNHTLGMLSLYFYPNILI